MKAVCGRKARGRAAVFASALALAACSALSNAPQAPGDARGARPELAYLEVINRARPPEDPQLLFLLSSQYANANRHAEGIAFFEERLRDFRSRLSPVHQALYLTALASLRAGQAQKRPWYSRLGWVRDTVAMLDEAKRLTQGRVFVVRWMSGVVRAQLPSLLGERDAALADLHWCESHAGEAPHGGWLREVYFRLGVLARQQGDGARADRYLALSGLDRWEGEATFTTPNIVDGDGHRFAPRRVREVVPGKVYVLSGIEFTEFGFVVSEDRRQLIAIDAGTRPDAAREALETLRREVPGLPPLTTLFVTHAHWDHVGGARAFRGLEPAVTFYGRGNYAEELARQADGPQNMLPRFFGTTFRMEDVMAYRPDRTIDRPTRIDIGGTAIELLPASGGETGDALLVFLPAERVLFAGDVIMPYLGAPFLEEGSVEGLLATIDLVARLQPRLVLHGHEPLTRVFTPEVMAALRTPLAWLRARVLEAVRRGEERGLIQQRNLIPPGMAEASSAVQLAYLVLRENVINRVYDRHVGYWQPDLQGMDALAARDYGAIFTRYLGVDDGALARAAGRMIEDGRYELAARVLQWVASVRALDGEEARLRRLAYVKLVEKYQEFNPFKLIVYAGEAGLALPPVPPPARGPERPRQP